MTFFKGLYFCQECLLFIDVSICLFIKTVDLSLIAILKGTSTLLLFFNLQLVLIDQLFFS